MNIRFPFVAVFAAIAGLAACTQNPPPTEPAAVAEVPAPVVEQPKPTATLLVEPGEVFACDGRDRAISTITWEVTDPAVEKVQVAVASDEDPERKNFAVGGVTGEATTGNWVVAGVRFYLVDAVTGKELATHQVTSSPCR